ncbi:1-aminocyclopropane-1-carboxylate synthase-like protein 1 isoform X2 [Phyllobates terribilis]|uniref:1-aminocyclopropane-1-carboxylate synthase-like protein 1 isoform X2 n=1 Tax=Phyllobates terribilis TaxID=111132 RepID=UPI003CCAC6C1
MESLSVRGREIDSEIDLLEQGFLMCLEDPYDKHSNPQGFVNIGTTENKVCFDLLKERLTRPDMTYLEPALLGYNDFVGMKSLREEAARFLTDYCHSPVPLNPNNVTEDHSLPFSLTIQRLEEGMEKARQQGIRVKVLILINPQNPLGEVYSPYLLKECLEFASRYSLHVILDEIYMLSVMNNDFTSVLSFQDLPDPKRRHFIWGLSKDFGMNGLRVGMLYTENKHVVHPMSRLANFHQCSGTTQYMVYQLLRDRDWLDNVFFPTNKELLRESQTAMVTGLEELKIPVLHRSTGMYVWADFRKFLTSQTFEAEMDLWKRFIAEKLCIAPGKAFVCSEPGWFRLTTCIPSDILQVFLERLKKVLQCGPQSNHSSISQKMNASDIY